MSLDDVIKQARKFGMNEWEVTIIEAEYAFHFNKYLDANINDKTSTPEAYRRFQAGKEYAEGRARQYVNRCIDSWQQVKEIKPVNDQ